MVSTPTRMQMVSESLSPEPTSECHGHRSNCPQDISTDIPVYTYQSQTKLYPPFKLELPLVMSLSVGGTSPPTTHAGNRKIIFAPSLMFHLQSVNHTGQVCLLSMSPVFPTLHHLVLRKLYIDVSKSLGSAITIQQSGRSGLKFCLHHLLAL